MCILLGGSHSTLSINTPIRSRVLGVAHLALVSWAFGLACWLLSSVALSRYVQTATQKVTQEIKGLSYSHNDRDLDLDKNDIEE